MQNAFCKFTLAFFVLLAAQTVFGQPAKKESPAPVDTSRNFCFRIIKPSESDCPVGEAIPYASNNLRHFFNLA